MIKVLIINGAFYDDLNANGSSVLHMASQGDQPGILIYFREKYNMDILAKDYQGSTCVHWACFTAAINSLNFLLSWINSEEINIRDNQGRTPLHIAIFSGKLLALH